MAADPRPRLTGAWDHAMLYARTVRHLRPSQVGHRIRLRTQRQLVGLWPERSREFFRGPLPEQPGWPEGWQPLDAQLPVGYPDPESNAEGTFTFLNDRRSLGREPGWDAPGAERLWRFHLHYFEWAWSFAAHPDREWARSNFARLYRSWRAAAPFGRADAWSPYVVALRSWALCGVYEPLIRGGALQREVLEDLAAHTGYLRWHLERDIGGNHLIKDLKALIGLGVFLDDDSLVRLAARSLARELPRQVLPDGGHYELSPSYHCQVLGDFIDVQALLNAAGHGSMPRLAEAIAAMRRWLGIMLMPDGDVPLFNDCVRLGTDRIKLLEPTPAPSDRLLVLRDSGYVVMRPDDRCHLVADVGQPGPPELPAHIHADCLSFELAIDGERVLVNSGTSTYQSGPRRQYERSTRAHNTLEIDGVDQTEVWGAFRAGRRARSEVHRTTRYDGQAEIEASHTGYQRLCGRPIHTRTWQACEGTIEILDEVAGVPGTTHDIRFMLHAAPAIVLDAFGSGAVAGPLRIRVEISSQANSSSLTLAARQARCAANVQGQLHPANGLLLAAHAPLPLRIYTRLTYSAAEASR